MYSPSSSSHRGGKPRSNAHTSHRRAPHGAGAPYRGGNSSRPSRGRGGNRGGGRKMPTFDPTRFINTNPATVEEVVYTHTHTFSTFGLDTRLSSIIEASGITIPTPIQDQIIPHIIKGHDVVGIAETGTGKTAAFLVPLIERTIKKEIRQTLILAPTRELAVQIETELRTLSKGLHVYSTIVVGGMSIGPQIRSLRGINHFIIGTPGRVLDLIERGNIQPRHMSAVVLDEADRMLDMGFINDMRTIISAMPKERQTLFFSATMSDKTDSLVREFLHKPITVSVKKQDVISTIEQTIVKYDAHSKFETLRALFNDASFSRVIIFGSMKHSVEALSKQLTEVGVPSESIHGNKNHTQRQRALSSFKNGTVKVLVATDVAARGIHVNDVSHVINYDLPQTFEDYVHRIGRTGRGKKRGKAISFVPFTHRY